MRATTRAAPARARRGGAPARDARGARAGDATTTPALARRRRRATTTTTATATGARGRARCVARGVKDPFRADDARATLEALAAEVRRADGLNGERGARRRRVDDARTVGR